MVITLELLHDLCYPFTYVETVSSVVVVLYCTLP